ncbi:hypothetical protein [Burkholderia perseverans]|uniref:hypothetical protein n=1 Tax=Burkholderia perseverans TaxID=2615214 RepID=UPI001FF066AC|nr:hypothetical protein [Burkholderia perseverans]
MSASRVTRPPSSRVDSAAAPSAAHEAPLSAPRGPEARGVENGLLGALAGLQRAAVQSDGAGHRGPASASRRGGVPFSPALSSDKATRIEAAARRMRDRPLNAVEREIGETYLLPRHLVAIAEAARILNVAVSFRPAGAQTLKRLEAGALPKPHGLSDKTIKRDALETVYGDKDEAARRMREARRNDIDGFVGHYRDGRLDGLYVQHSQPGMSALPLEPAPEAPGWKYLPLDHDHLREDLVRLQHTPDFVGALVTGDYDMHDAINLSGTRGPLVEGQELSLISGINCAVGAVDARRPFDQPALGVVQHGPQYNYLAHMRNREPGARIDERVTAPSLPVAMCDRGRWSIIRTEAELSRFYSDHGIRGKSGWTGSQGSGTSSRESSRRGSLADATESRRGSLAEIDASRRGSLGDIAASRRGSLAEIGTSRRVSLAEIDASRRGSLVERDASQRGSAAEAGAMRRGSGADIPAQMADSGIDMGTGRRDSGDGAGMNGADDGNARNEVAGNDGRPRRGSATSLGNAWRDAAANPGGARRGSADSPGQPWREPAAPRAASDVGVGRGGMAIDDFFALAARNRPPPAEPRGRAATMEPVAEGVEFNDPFAAAREPRRAPDEPPTE